MQYKINHTKPFQNTFKIHKFSKERNANISKTKYQRYLKLLSIETCASINNQRHKTEKFQIA